MAEPLQGIQVLEVAGGIQGPAAGLYLAQMGASVIKVEPPEGEPNRFYRGVGNKLTADAPGPQFVASNLGKRCMSLDAHSEKGREVLHRLSNRSDVFLSNYRNEALERMGLGYETLRGVNPGIVYAHVDGFGRRGPDAAKGMVDGAGQARGGICSVTGYADGPPLMPGAAIADTAGAMQLALGIVTALLARERLGMGQRVDTSSYAAQLWLQMWEITHSSLTGHLLSREGPHHPNIPGGYGTYQTADGRAILLAFALTEESWCAFCESAGFPELGTDPRWNSVRKRQGMDSDEMGRTASELRQYLETAFKSKTLAEWRELLDAQPEIIYEAICDYRDVLNDEQAAANDYIVDIEIPGVGSRKVVGNLIHLSETPGSVKPLIAEMEQHSEEILLELGYSWDEISEISRRTRAALRQKLKALGTEAPE